MSDGYGQVRYEQLNAFNDVMAEELIDASRPSILPTGWRGKTASVPALARKGQGK